MTGDDAIDEMIKSAMTARPVHVPGGDLTAAAIARADVAAVRRLYRWRRAVTATAVVLTAVLIAVAVRARLAAGGFGDVFPQQATSSASAAPVWCWLGFVAVVLTMVAQAVRATMRRPVVWTVGQWNRQACP